MVKIYLNGKSPQLAEEQPQVHSACIGPLMMVKFLLHLGWTAGLILQTLKNMPYECKGLLLGREVFGFMERAGNTYCKDDASGG